MGNIFSGSEIVEIAIQIEKNGKDFYDMLADKAKKVKAKEIFRYLSTEEEKHIAVFQGLLNGVQKYEPPESYPGEYFAYMSTLAGEYVFTRENMGAEIAKKTPTDKAAINLGIGFEKDSIIFYEGVKKIIPEYDLKTIDALITQEQHHLQILSDLKIEV